MRNNNGDDWLPVPKKRDKQLPSAPPKPHVGQRAKLDDWEKRTKVIELIGQGLCIRHSCAVINITATAYYDYKKTHPDFARDVEAALARGVEQRLQIIEAASAKDWRAASWWLQSVFPSVYGRNRVEISGVDGQPIEMAMGVQVRRKHSAIYGEVLEVDLPDYDDADR